MAQNDYGDLWERWLVWKEKNGGEDPDAFLRHYNKNHGTSWNRHNLDMSERQYTNRQGGGTGGGGGGGGGDQSVTADADGNVTYGSGGDTYEPGNEDGTNPGDIDAPGSSVDDNQAQQDAADAAAEQAEREREAADKLATQKDAYATILSILTDYGLESLAPWIWDQILNDVPEAQIFLDLRKRPEYQRRFPGMDKRRAKGLRALSEAEYIMAEESYRQTLRRWGADPSKFDDPSDFSNYFENDISAEEVDQRGEIWYQIAHAPNTTARLKGLIRQYTGTADVSDEQLFKALVEADQAILNNLNIGLQGAGVNNASIENLKSYIQKAYKTEVATWRGGGGRAKEQGGFNVGVVGASEERFT